MILDYYILFIIIMYLFYLIFFTNYIIFIYDLLCLAMCLYNIAFLFSSLLLLFSLGFSKCSDIVNHFLCCFNALAIQNVCFCHANKLSELN